MIDNGKTQLDIRILRERDPELFEVLNVPGRSVEKLREIVLENERLQEENEGLRQGLEEFQNNLVGIKLSSRQAQKNTDMLLGIVNILLFTQQMPQPFSHQEKQHPYLAFFDTQYRNMLDDLVQRRVYKDKKSQDEVVSEVSTFETEDNPFD